MEKDADALPFLFKSERKRNNVRIFLIKKRKPYNLTLRKNFKNLVFIRYLPFTSSHGSTHNIDLYTVRSNGSLDRTAGNKAFLRPDVKNIIFVLLWQIDKAEVCNFVEVNANALFAAELVENADGNLGVFKRLNKNIDQTRFNSSALNTELILIDGNHCFVCEDTVNPAFGINGAVRLNEFSDIVSENERSAHHAPERKVRHVFIVSEVSVADLEHIRVVPAADIGILPQPDIGFIN